MFGILNIDKPAGLSSRDVVNRVQRLVRPAKVGHAGTLDPLATGVLVVCVGPATRLISYVQRMPKRYCGTFLLGHESATEDTESEVVKLEDAPQPTRDELLAVLPSFTGKIRQLPPAFSALKVKGQRAYELARRGKTVELQPREIEIHALDLIKYDYPDFELDIECGSGTYVRSLGRDIGKRLNSGAVMTALARTAVGSFHQQDATTLEDLTEETLSRHLLPAETAVADLLSVQLVPSEVTNLANGIMLENRFGVTNEAAAFDANSGRLCALLAKHRSGKLRPQINFTASLAGQLN